jgi:phosphoribosylamine--glycine ligase
MNILVIGSGGREHALCWAIAKSPRCTKLYCAPGNAGIAQIAECVAIGVEEIERLVAFATNSKIDLAVVGPEVPLVMGLVDAFEAAGIRAFGPGAKAAMLEGSKGFVKDLAIEHGIPTGSYGRFTVAAEAEAYIRAQGAPIVVKADGLAAGKGVTVAMTLDDALRANADLFSVPGAEVVIEEYLEGEEVSYFALVDGRHALPFASAQDHKRVGDGDIGPNTGGMGAYTPVPALNATLERTIMDKIIQPTVDAMIARGAPFKGMLFAGIMLTTAGPKLYEYNVRFGDPECQALMSRLKTDVVDVLEATIDGTLDRVKLEWNDGASLVVVMAANGYPGSYAKGSEIRGLDAAAHVPGVSVFHAGTCSDGARILADGGRVLGIVGTGATVAEAQVRAYAGVDAIDWPDGFCRRDIGWRAVSRH